MWEAREKGLGSLAEFADSVCRDFRDHVEEHGKRRVQGYCPMGCGESLYLAAQGVVECVKPDCPNPIAVTAILWEAETQHLVGFAEDGWSARHPLRERLNNELLTCGVAEAVEIMLKADVDIPGVYRVAPSPIGPGGWSWERVQP
jgi:hypothetical protein